MFFFMRKTEKQTFAKSVFFCLYITIFSGGCQEENKKRGEPFQNDSPPFFKVQDFSEGQFIPVPEYGGLLPALISEGRY